MGVHIDGLCFDEMASDRDSSYFAPNNNDLLGENQDFRFSFLIITLKIGSERPQNTQKPVSLPLSMKFYPQQQQKIHGIGQYTVTTTIYGI